MAQSALGKYSFPKTEPVVEQVQERWLVHGAGHVRAGGAPAGAHTATTSLDASAERARFVAAHPRGDMTGP